MTCPEHEGPEGQGHEGPGHEGPEGIEGFDCSRARLQLYEYLDGEMDLDDVARIREHLAHCRPCLEEYDIDQIIKALVRRSCHCEAAPTELRTQIMSRITTFTMTVEYRD